ncbi:MAG: hypothetical protein NVS2B12_31710 [Ktedonobacteraceae bacterium]
MWCEYRVQPRTIWRGWILPLALLLTAAEQVSILLSYTLWNNFLTPFILVLCLLSAASLLVAKIWADIDIRLAQMVQRPAVVVSIFALLVTPAIWSVYSTLVPGNSSLATAGPQQANSFFANFARVMGRGNTIAERSRAGGGIPGFGSEQADSKLLVIFMPGSANLLR